MRQLQHPYGTICRKYNQKTSYVKILFDLLPIFLFFIAYKVAGIYAATAVAMIATLSQMAWLWWRERHLEFMHIMTLVLILVLGSATLLLHNPMFIKWKPTAVYWLFAIAFAVSQYVGKESLLKKAMGKQLQLPQTIWFKLNLSWVCFFLLLGTLNIIVAYHASENTWVNFKLFGTTSLTILFVLGQAIRLNKYTPQDTIEHP